MTEEEADIAHAISEEFQNAIVNLGSAMLLTLNEAQREYVITKAHDEFRFWRVKDAAARLHRCTRG